MKAQGRGNTYQNNDQAQLVFTCGSCGKLLNSLLEQHPCANAVYISSRPQRRAASHTGAATWGLYRRNTTIDPVTGSIHNVKVTHSIKSSLSQADSYSKGFIHIALSSLFLDGLNASMLNCTWQTSPLSPIRNLGSPEVQLFCMCGNSHCSKSCEDTAHQRVGQVVIATQGYCPGVRSQGDVVIQQVEDLLELCWKGSIQYWCDLTCAVYRQQSLE